MNPPPDHTTRLKRAKLSLDALAIGDALGEMLAYDCANARAKLERGLPGGPWFHTDDTEMALSVYETLRDFSRVIPDDLARRFAQRYQFDPDRGYGKATRILLRGVLDGGDWRKLSAEAFGGAGSFGNGAAMRIAPLGAFFAGDGYNVIRREAANSAMVTHTHYEAQVGAIAVAQAAALAWQLRGQPAEEAGGQLLVGAYDCLPNSEVKKGLGQALKLTLQAPVQEAAQKLGNGAYISAQDTVPFVIWSAARRLGDFKEAMISTAIADGDVDTNCAMVAGIVALYTGYEGIPEDWLAARERFNFEKARGAGAS